MSVFLDIADAMKAAIEAAIPTSDIGVIVDRQSDLGQEFKKRINKVKGGVAIIEFISAPSADKHANPPTFNGKYSITLWGENLLRNGKQPLDDILQKVCQTLQHWKSDNTDPLCYSEAQVGDVRTIQNEHFLIYQLNITKQLQLPTS